MYAKPALACSAWLKSPESTYFINNINGSIPCALSIWALTSEHWLPPRSIS